MRRLKTHSQFRAVLVGPRIASTAHFVLHQRDLTDVGLSCAAPPATDGGVTIPGPAWLRSSALGAMVPKRWVKRAVTRNMIKRQIYTVGAMAEAALPAAAYVVRLRAGFDRQRFISASSLVLKKLVRDELNALFSRPRAVGSGVLPARQP